MKNFLKFVVVIPVCAVLFGCGGQEVRRVDDKTITDLSGRWNDTDSQLVTEQMVKEALDSAWLGDYLKAKGKNPTVIVGTIINKTDEHIDTGVFQNDIERTLTNSNRVTFVASKEERQEVRDERADQQDYASDKTKKEFKQEMGADYMMQGTISSVVDQKQGEKAVYYQVDMVLVDLATNAKTWYGQKKIKKIITRGGFGL